MVRGLSAAGLLLYAALAGCGSPNRTFVAIGTAGVTGVYYPVGGALATLINDTTGEHGIRASVESTGGSVFNINAVLQGDLEVGVSQADRQYQAWTGKDEWAELGPQTELRSICSLYTEMVTAVGAEDAGIRALEDLRGKRVNIGNPGSGSRANAIDALASAGLNWETDLLAEGIKASESAKLLQDDRIDAYFFTVGHPAGSFMEASAGRRQVRFLPIAAPESLIERSPYYTHALIPIRYYPNALNTEDVPTIGLKVTLVTSIRVPETVIYAVARVLFEHLGALREQHPALHALDAREMLLGLSAPLHPGAERYYREAGLIKEP